MNRNDFADNLFSGIPSGGGRRSGKFFTSLSIHAAVVALLLLTSPQILLRSSRTFQFNTTLIAPPETRPIPRRTPAVTAVTPEPAAPRALRPLPQATEAHITLPKLDQAPALPSVARPTLPLPAPEVTIRPAVQTGVFAADTAPRVENQPTVAAAREAGFDHVKPVTLAPVSSAAAAAGFDLRAADARTASASGTIQTGAFGQAAAEPHSARFVAANVAHTTFDVQAESDKPAAADSTVRRTGFDEPKPVNAPAKQPVASAPAALRPLQILDKPKPAYTAEARAEKIEGTVLLDVIFAASGEVRVLGVVRGLGHGLDQSAEDAARRIRFTPAMRSGAPVDQRVVLHVVFQITG